MVEEKKKLVGKVSHYYTGLGVGVIELEDELKVGDEILIEGKTTSFKQKVDSMEIDRKAVEQAGKGQSIGLKVEEKVRENDSVFKLVE